MTDEALELATSEELVNELMRRQTFVGIIIRPLHEVRDEYISNEFQMSIRNMSRDVAEGVLEFAINSLETV